MVLYILMMCCMSFVTGRRELGCENHYVTIVNHFFDFSFKVERDL